MRIQSLRSPIILLAAAGLAAAGATQAASAASISGTVRFEGGRAPVMQPIDMSRGGQCHAYHDEPPLSEEVVIGEHGAMKNVFVRVVAGLPPGTYHGPTQPLLLTQEGCLFKPHVLGIQVRQTLRVLSSDLLLHNVNIVPEKARAFNVSMPPGKKAFEHTFYTPEFPIEVKCDIHEHMKAYIGVIDHPYFAVTGENGTYEIAGLQPGAYEIEVWQEFWAAQLGAMKFAVTLEDGESKICDIIYSAGKQAEAHQH